MILSDYLENKLLDRLLRNQAFTQPALHVALLTAAPSDSGGGTECIGGSYARVAVSNDNTNFPQCAVTGTPTKSNATAIVFPTATAAWGTATHWAIYDAATVGNLLVHGPLSTPRYVASGDTPRIAAGQIAITASNAAGGGLTAYSVRKLLDHTFGGPTYTPAVTIYTGLGTALSGESLTEWSDPSYSRQATAFDAASSGSVVNADAETYTASVTAGGDATLTHFAIFDGVSAGNLLAVGPLSTSRSVVELDSVTLADGTLSVSFQ
jgi:hypothetical protein